MFDCEAKLRVLREFDQLCAVRRWVLLEQWILFCLQFCHCWMHFLFPKWPVFDVRGWLLPQRRQLLGLCRARMRALHCPFSFPVHQLLFWVLPQRKYLPSLQHKRLFGLQPGQYLCQLPAGILPFFSFRLLPLLCCDERMYEMHFFFCLH